MTLDGSEINILIAFVAGFITFFASCLLPLVPAYLAYISGVSLNSGEQKRTVFVNSVLFSFGFILVFILLGASATLLGSYVRYYSGIFEKIGGIFLVLMGLFMLKVISPDFLLKERRLDPTKSLTKWQKVNSVITGATFGFAWTPCIGPVLGVILFWASQAESMARGITMLVSYGLGIGLPFILIGLLFEKVGPRITKQGRFGDILNKIAAILIIATGLLLFFGKIQYLSLGLLNTFNLHTLSR